MSEQSAQRAEPARVEWFDSGGRVTGAVGVVLCAAAAVICIVDRVHPAIVIGIVFFGVLVYVSLLRPRVGTTADTLVYRRMFSDLAIPLAAISQMRVARYFEVTVGTRRLVSPAVGRSLRRTVWRQERDPLKVYADLVEDQTHARMETARARAGHGASDAAVRRTWAWPEIVVALVVLVAFVVALVV